VTGMCFDARPGHTNVKGGIRSLKVGVRVVSLEASGTRTEYTRMSAGYVSLQIPFQFL